MSEVDKSVAKSVLRFIRREPLVHFLGLAALLFLANAMFSGDDREIITFDVATQEYLIQTQQDLLLRPLSDDEKQDIIDNFIEEEILFREARRRGFDNSSRIRTLMIRNMRFFLSQETPQPSEDGLRSFYQNNPERFTSSPTISYDHVLFRNPDEVPNDTLTKLRAGADHTRMGNRDGMSGIILRKVNQRVIAQAFGPEVAPEIVAIDDDLWRGPFVSGEDVYFLRVAKRHESTLPAFEDIRDWIEANWVTYMRRQHVETALDEMRENFIIDVQQPVEVAN